MAKIARLFFFSIFIITTLIGASDYLSQLRSYDIKIDTANKDELLKVHHALKRVYIYSIVQNNNTIKKEALKRLIKTSKILNFDYSGYEKELKTFDKILNESKNGNLYKKEKTNANKISHTRSNIKRNRSIPSLKKINIFEDKIEILFDRKLNFKDIKRFFLNTHGVFREVFDLKAILTYKPKITIPRGLVGIRVAQYNKNTTRIVLQRKKNVKSNYSVDGKKLKIFLSSKKKLEGLQNKIKNSEENKLAINLNRPIKNRIIVLDAGHGGKDVGAVGSKREYEKHLVLRIALKTGKILKQRGYRVYYTRTKDKFVRLRDRTKFANKKNADLFLSIHANAAKKKTLHGVETFFLSPARSKRSKNVAALENRGDLEEMNYFSKQTFLNVLNREKIIQANKLALDVQQGILNRLRKKYGGVRDGGVREAPFWVLVGAQMPAILIEIGYITNYRERKRMFNSHYQNLIAKGIADGIDSYFIKNKF